MRPFADCGKRNQLLEDSMREAVFIFAAIVSVMIGVGTLHFLYLLLWKPELTAVPAYEFRKWPAWRRGWHRFSMGAAFIGVGVMLYKGVEGALWFVPKNWRHLNQDGESEWIGHGVALLVSLVGSVMGLSKLAELSGKRAREFWNRQQEDRFKNER